MSTSCFVRPSAICSGMVLLGLALLVQSGLAAADAWDAAKTRHTWTWFALSEAQADAEARRQGGDHHGVSRRSHRWARGYA